MFDSLIRLVVKAKVGLSTLVIVFLLGFLQQSFHVLDGPLSFEYNNKHRHHLYLQARWDGRPPTVSFRVGYGPWTPPKPADQKPWEQSFEYDDQSPVGLEVVGDRNKVVKCLIIVDDDLKDSKTEPGRVKCTYKLKE